MNALATTSSLFVQPTRGCVTDFYRVRDALTLALAGTLFNDGYADPRDVDELLFADTSAPSPFSAVHVEDRHVLRGHALTTVLTVHRDDRANRLVCETSVRLSAMARGTHRDPVTLAVLFKRLSVQGTRWSTPDDMPAWRLNVYDEGRAPTPARMPLGHDRLADLVPEPHGLPLSTQAALANKLRQRLSGNDRRWLTDNEAELAARTLGAALKHLAAY